METANPSGRRSKAFRLLWRCKACGAGQYEWSNPPHVPPALECVGCQLAEGWVKWTRPYQIAEALLNHGTVTDPEEFAVNCPESDMKGTTRPHLIAVLAWLRRWGKQPAIPSPDGATGVTLFGRSAKSGNV